MEHIRLIWSYLQKKEKKNQEKFVLEIERKRKKISIFFLEIFCSGMPQIPTSRMPLICNFASRDIISYK